MDPENDHQHLLTSQKERQSDIMHFITTYGLVRKTEPTWDQASRYNYQLTEQDREKVKKPLGSNQQTLECSTLY